MSQSPRFVVKQGSPTRPSIFASHTTRVLEDLADPPHTIVIKKLSGQQLERASQENTFASVDTLRRLGGAAFQKELAAIGDEATRAKQVAAVQADPMNGFDKYMLLRYGIQSWTYTYTNEHGVECPVSLTPESVIEESGVSVSRIKAIDDLESDAVAELAEHVLRTSKPSLFVEVDEAAVAEKNA